MVFWLAPEFIDSPKQGYDKKIDIWSVGCVVLEMWTGKRPWSGDEVNTVLFKVGCQYPRPKTVFDVLVFSRFSSQDYHLPSAAVRLFCLHWRKAFMINVSRCTFTLHALLV